MGNILIIGEDAAVVERLKSILSGHLWQAHIQTVKPRQVLRFLSSSHWAMVIFVAQNGDDIQTTLVSEIKLDCQKVPLLMYGRFDQMDINVFGLLDAGVNGFLSVQAPQSEHIRAIDALMRGDTYIDKAVKWQALVHLLQDQHQ